MSRSQSNGRRVFILENKVSVCRESVPLFTAYVPFPDYRGRILIIYGGITERNFSKNINYFWAKHLARLGFVVHYFDFRSNLTEDIYKYGLYDRLEDTRAVVDFLLTRSLFKSFPLSLMGFSMGGHIAVDVASSVEYRDCIKNLVLVVPGAYNDKAVCSNVKFGPEFSGIIRQKDSWLSSTIFARSKAVTADCLVVACTHDEVVPQQIPWTYYANLAQPRGNSPAVSRKIICELDGFKHGGNYDNPMKRWLICQNLLDFFENAKPTA